jgi:hypothetical protein
MAIQVARSFGFTAHEYEEFFGLVMVDVAGYGELIELHYRRSATGYLAFDYGFIHGKTSGDKTKTWKDTRDMLRSVAGDASVEDDDRDPLSEIENMRDWGDS